MNKKTIILISALAIIILAFFFLRRNIGSTMSGNEMDFGYATTDKIDKIFMSNNSSREYILLTKQDARNWTVNKDYKANPSQVDILLETLRKMKVKRPVAKGERETVLKDFVLNGTKVEIYESGKLSKVFFVGRNTADEMGSYFYMENAKEPYVCYIPGFNGYLNSRFFTNLNAWRSKTVFNYKEEEIKTIQLTWTEAPDKSFVINNENNAPVLSTGNKVFGNNTEVNLNKLKSYMKLWENLSYEGHPIDLKRPQIDSIANSAPFLIIKVTDKKGQATTLSIYRKGIRERTRVQHDTEGNPLDFDIEAYYAFVNDNKREIVQIQDFIFGKVMKRNSDFFLE